MIVLCKEGELKSGCLNNQIKLMVAHTSGYPKGILIILLIV